VAISIDSRVVAIRDQVAADVGGEAVILSLRNGVYYGLDPVGARIWSLIEEPRSVREIRDALLEEYDVDSEQCEASVVRLLEELASNDLIEVEDA
jgi:hypothetical protein